MTADALEQARRLAPVIAAAAAETEARRALAPAIVEALHDAGMYRLLLPRSLSGAELDLAGFSLVTEELAKADASTAWLGPSAKGGRVVPHHRPSTMSSSSPEAAMDTSLATTLTPTLVFGAMSTGMSFAVRSRMPRVAASNPVVPTSSGTPASAQARALAATQPAELKSTATAAALRLTPASAVITTPVGSPSSAASSPSAELADEAMPPQRLNAPPAPWASRSARTRDCPMRPVIPKTTSPGIPDLLRSYLLHVPQRHGDIERLVPSAPYVDRLQYSRGGVRRAGGQLYSSLPAGSPDPAARLLSQSTAPVKNFLTPSKKDCSRG